MKENGLFLVSCVSALSSDTNCLSCDRSWFALYIISKSFEVFSEKFVYFNEFAATLCVQILELWKCGNNMNKFANIMDAKMCGFVILFLTALSYVESSLSDHLQYSEYLYFLKFVDEPRVSSRDNNLKWNFLLSDSSRYGDCGRYTCPG